VAHLGALQQAGAALALSFTNVTGMSLLVGCTSALDTLASQAHGAGASRALGSALMRTWAACFILSVFISLVWAAAPSIFVACRQDAALSAHAGTFARYFIPHIWLVALGYPLQKVLNAQEVQKPFFFVGLLLLLFHIFVSRACVRRWGYVGAAFGTIFTDMLQLAATSAIFVVHERRKAPAKRCWPRATEMRRLTTGWAAFWRLALPSMATLFCEWSVFELVTLLSGLLPGSHTGVPTAASSIAINTVMLVFSFPLGIAIASSQRVGNALGAGDPAAARAATVTTLALALLSQAGLATGLALLGGGAYGRLFTGGGETGKPTLAAFRSLLPTLAALVAADGVQTCLSACARGAGMQKLLSLVNFGTYYGLGLPLGCGLAFGAPHLGLRGLWIGLACATHTQAVLIGALLVRLDWAKAAREARERALSEAAGGEALTEPLLDAALLEYEVSEAEQEP